MRRLLFLAIFLLLLLSFGYPSHAHSQETLEEVVETETPIGVDGVSTESASTEPARINYELPYPGMLPDHPLYILKVIRDGVVKLLINEPIKRARFSLISAEKRMYAGKLLVEKGKDELAVETISKGNNYLSEALEAIEIVKKETPKHLDIEPFLLQFRSAALKHRELAQDIKPSIDKEFIGQFEKEQHRIDNFVKTAESKLGSK